jgi:hypothetical protein
MNELNVFDFIERHMKEHSPDYDWNADPLSLTKLQADLHEAIKESDEWRVPDETTPKMAIVWVLFDTSWIPMPLVRMENAYSNHLCLLAKENQGPPPDDWRPK